MKKLFPKKITSILLITFNLIIAHSSMATPLPPPALWITSGADARPLLIGGNLKIQPTNKHEQNAAKKYTLDVHYPQITGTPLDSNAKQFNRLIQTKVDENINSFKQNANVHLLPKEKSYFNMDYDLASFVSQSQHTNYISIRFNIHSYERGMAHPTHRILVVNYDLGHGQPLTLTSLFKPSANYLAIIADYCFKTLAAKKIPIEMLKTGTAPQPSNYRNWNFTLSGLLITFNEAQVAPRYFGIQQVLIPKAALSHIVNPQAACTLGFILCDKT